MTTMRSRESISHRHAAGFSLVEVLIAVLVFSIGLLGAGILNASAMKNTHNAYLRSQASFLADSIAAS